MASLEGSIQLWTQDAADWTADNPVLLAGQPGAEGDTGQLKIGDGTTAWNSLDYVGVGGTIDATPTNGSNNAVASNGVYDALITKKDRVSELISGSLSVGSYGGAGVNNDIRATATTYYIVGTGVVSAAQTDFLDIALSAAGMLRYVGIYGQTNGTLTKVEGVEGESATLPTQPANTAVIGFVLVGDATIVEDDTPPTIDPVPADGSSNAVASDGVFDALALKANLASPALTGNPTAPTQLLGNSSTRLATTAFVAANRNTYMVRLANEQSTNPTDGQTLYFGTLGSTGAGAQGTRRFPFPHDGIIRQAVFYIRVATTLGTNENSTLSVQLNGATDYLISNTIKMNTSQQIITYTGLTIPCVFGEYCEGKIEFPNFATNPTNVLWNLFLLVEPA